MEALRVLQGRGWGWGLERGSRLWSCQVIQKRGKKSHSCGQLAVRDWLGRRGNPVPQSHRLCRGAPRWAEGKVWQEGLLSKLCNSRVFRQQPLPPPDYSVGTLEKQEPLPPESFPTFPEKILSGKIQNSVKAGSENVLQRVV